MTRYSSVPCTCGHSAHVHCTQGPLCVCGCGSLKTHYTIRCSQCGRQIGFYDNLESALDQWSGYPKPEAGVRR